MNTKSNILFIHAQTSLHPGSGTGTSAIDLPVQRERHTDWPLIPGSTIKGVLRDYCRIKIAEENSGQDLTWADRDPELECVFGPSQKGQDSETQRGTNPSDMAGALAVTDARILFFPVRSLCGLFVWVTCPAVFERLARDVEISNVVDLKVPSPIQLKGQQDAWVVSDVLLLKNSSVGADGANMVLEEFDFKASKQEGNGLQTFAKTIAQKLDLKRLETHLAVISDDMFTHFVKNATEVSARIALDYETKTASEGALFYVETLPPETVFYSLLIADRPKGKRKQDGKIEKPVLENEASVLNYVDLKLKAGPAILQIGAEASTGKGICRVCGGAK